MRIASHIFCFLLIISHLQSYARPGEYRFSKIDISRGLSNNRVNCIFEDSQGFMWFGTMAGLNRYDGYTVKVFKHSLHDSLTLVDDYVLKIFNAPGNKLFVQTRNGGSVYDPSTESFINPKLYFKSLGLPQDGTITTIAKTAETFWFIYNNGGMYKVSNGATTILKPFIYVPNPLAADVITDAKTDLKGNLVLIRGNRVLEKMDAYTNKIIFRTDAIARAANGRQDPLSMFIDKDDDIWAYAPYSNGGIQHYNVGTGAVKLLSKENGILTSDIVTSVIEDDKNNLWIGTDQGGINVINKTTLSGFALLHTEGDDRSVAENAIYALYKDETGIIWSGTFKKGVSYYADNIIKFPVFRHQPSEKASLSYDDVNRFAEDGKGNIWIGTNGGGLVYFNRQANTFTPYRHSSTNANTISNDIIISLCIDHEQKLWIGSYFGGLDCYDGKTFTHYKHKDGDPGSLADDRVWEIYEDADRNLWIGTLGGGLDKFDRAKKTFYHHTASMPNSVLSNYITSFVEDNNGGMWISTAYGIDVLQKKTGAFIHYSANKNKLSNGNTYSLLKDHNGNIWVGTRDGLDVFDPSTQCFQTFRTEDGLPDNAIFNILEDNNHYIWASTNNGIAKITVRRGGNGFAISAKNYDELDGLQGRVFNENAALKTKDGELIFGGPGGFNMFDPSAIKENKNKPAVVITGFQVFSKPVNAGEKINGRVILPKSIIDTKEVTLQQDEDVFSIEFSGLNFSNSEKNKYAYKLEGFDKEWLPADSKTRRVTYTNLDAGGYTFRVKASNDDGVWNEAGSSLKITILPPFWKTGWAYLLYVLVTACALLFARRMIIRRTKIRFAIEQERKEAQHMHELDMMKIRFFTNVSHDFRTPLSLIITPLDKIIKNAADPAQKHQFLMIHRNAKRLLNLVNQLLDFRKMELQELKLNLSKGDIVHFIKNISYSFTDVAEKKNIGFSYKSSVECLFTVFDHDKIERVLFNLLSNAFKFTPGNGTVSVELSSTDTGGGTLLEIKVKDTGIGIPAEKHEKIFERFFQDDIPGNMVNQGSGIGLSISKEFIKLHNGTITVDSDVNKGSCFTLVLPLKQIAGPAAEPVPDYEEKAMEAELLINEFDDADAEQATALAGKPNGKAVKKPSVLIVEDNDDLRFYLKDNLKQYFNITEATNGKAGWQKALASHPDVIVSDVNMPEMTGIELCKKIKGDKRTCFVPVILLTALTGDEQQLKGLETGANDYITKPFNFEILLSKIKNLAAQQETVKRVYQKHVNAGPSEIQIDSADEKFMQHALEVVEKNIANPDFSVEELSRELFMSRVALYKKILALTFKTPIEFIRAIRLKRAAQLLEKSGLTIAEIAYEVGFNDPKYFSRFFKTEFNMLPSAYQAEKRKETADACALEMEEKTF